MAIATTYKIEYVVNIGGKECQKETTFISKADNVPDAIERFKKQLSAEQAKTFALIDCFVKHTSGLKISIDSALPMESAKPADWLMTPEQREARLSAFERDEKTPAENLLSDYEWRLTNVDYVLWRPDDSGVFCLVNWQVQTNTVRIDLIEAISQEPIVSFAGKADNVRKALTQWIDDQSRYTLSAEHTAYIGAELERADTQRIDYVQDEGTTPADNNRIFVIDADRYKVFLACVPTVQTFDDSPYYLHQCQETRETFLVCYARDDSIARIDNVPAFLASVGSTPANTIELDYLAFPPD